MQQGESFDCLIKSSKSITPQGDGNVQDSKQQKPREAGSKSITPQGDGNSSIARFGILISCSKSITPQGDGNVLHEVTPVRHDVVQNPLPRKGTETVGVTVVF